MLVVGLLIQALAAGTYFFVSQLGEFYAVAVVFGIAYGGVMPLYAVLAREYFPLRIMGTVFGAATMVSSLGMALGPAVGGWIFDTLRQLRLALYRLVRHGPRRGGDRARLPALPVGKARRSPAGVGVMPARGRGQCSRSSASGGGASFRFMRPS